MADQHDYSAKHVFWLLLNGALVLAMVLGLVGIGALVRYSNAIVPSRTITVTGEGKTEVKPDLATLSFAVISQGTDPAKIQQDNTDKINRAIAFVKQQGVKDADIQTTNYNLYPRYKYDKEGGESSISSYELNQTVTVKIHDLAKVSTIVGGLPAAGINQINSLQYSVEDPEAQRAAARQEAFANAFTKASQMAAQNNVRVVRVITFSESANEGGPIYYAAEAKGGAVPAPAPNLEPGSEEVKISVSVTYEIR